MSVPAEPREDIVRAQPAPTAEARAAQSAPARRPAAPVAAVAPVTVAPQVAPPPPPTARSADESHDPSAIINWLLQRRGEEK